MSASINKNILIGALACSLLIACGDVKEEAKKQVLRPVRTLTVAAPNLNQVHQFNAVVDASRKADLSFKVSGELVKFNVNEGESVAKGQVIASLNDRDIKIQLQEAQSSFDKANADYRRGKNLMGSKSISQADFDQLKASFNSAQSKLSSAKNNLEYTQLTASFAGVIAKRYTDNFQEVNAKSPIVALHDLSNIVLKIEIPESIMINIKRKDKPPKLTATFDAIPNRQFQLTFKEAATQADEVTKTYQITLTMKAPKDLNLLPGMVATVTSQRTISNDENHNVLYLPANSVLSDSTGHYIFTVTSEQEGVGIINRRAVTIGDLTIYGLEILAGIEQGDVVLSAGMSKVSNGMAVKY